MSKRFEGKWRRSQAAGRVSARPSAGGWPRRGRSSPRSISPSDRAQGVIGNLPGAVAVRADVSDSASVEEALSKVETDLGPLAIMVNNAGALAMSHVARVKPLIEKQQAEQAEDGLIKTPLEALVRADRRGVALRDVGPSRRDVLRHPRRRQADGAAARRARSSTWPRSAGSRDAPDTRTTPPPRPASSASPGPRRRK